MFRGIKTLQKMRDKPSKGPEGPNQITRRTLVRGFLAGSVLSYLAPRTPFAGLNDVPSNAGKPKAQMVPTVTGPFRCDSLGTTLMHEHVLSSVGPRTEDQGYVPIPDDKREESVDFAASLLNDAGRVGINTLVDLLP